MTKKLAELFELPEPQKDEEPPPSQELMEAADEAASNLEKIEAALPQVRGLETSDTELDEIASLAVNSYKDLQELGMQVDSRFSSEIFAVAATFLNHAITAKVAKGNKKLRTIELQLKKAALDQRIAERDKEVNNIPAGTGENTGMMLDRNELLRMIAKKQAPKSESK